MKWYFIVALICIFLWTSDVDHMIHFQILKYLPVSRRYYLQNKSLQQRYEKFLVNPLLLQYQCSSCLLTGWLHVICMSVAMGHPYMATALRVPRKTRFPPVRSSSYNLSSCYICIRVIRYPEDYVYLHRL